LKKLLNGLKIRISSEVGKKSAMIKINSSFKASLTSFLTAGFM
jgi:hypothetical protein